LSYSGRDLLLSGLFLALALVLPILFHAVGLGSEFLPMFFPILLAGFLLPFPMAVSVGIMAPLLSALLTGMPPFFPPLAFIMMVEGAVLTAVPALLYRKIGIPLYPVLALTIVADRLVLLAVVMFTARWLDLPEGALSLVSVIRGLPGCVLIMILIPPLVKEMRKRVAMMMIQE